MTRVLFPGIDSIKIKTRATSDSLKTSIVINSQHKLKTYDSKPISASTLEAYPSLDTLITEYIVFDMEWTRCRFPVTAQFLAVQQISRDLIPRALPLW